MSCKLKAETMWQNKFVSELESELGRHGKEWAVAVCVCAREPEREKESKRERRKRRE